MMDQQQENNTQQATTRSSHNTLIKNAYALAVRYCYLIYVKKSTAAGVAVVPAVPGGGGRDGGRGNSNPRLRLMNSPLLIVANCLGRHHRHHHRAP